MLGTAIAALGQILNLTSEYETADEQRRQEIHQEADAAYQQFKIALSGLPAALQADDQAADAAAKAQPSGGIP